MPPDIPPPNPLGTSGDEDEAEDEDDAEGALTQQPPVHPPPPPPGGDGGDGGGGGSGHAFTEGIIKTKLFSPNGANVNKATATIAAQINPCFSICDFTVNSFLYISKR